MHRAAGRLPIPRSDHADVAADMALGMFDDLADFNREQQMQFEIRIGLNSGPLVAGIISFAKFSYDLWCVHRRSIWELTCGAALGSRGGCHCRN